MKSIITTTVLVFSVSFLVGCGGSKTTESTDPALKLEEVADLDECTRDQKRELDRRGTRGNKASDVTAGLCVNTEDSSSTEAEIQREFESLRDAAAAGERGSCKWTYRSEVWYCSPRSTTTTTTTTTTT